MDVEIDREFLEHLKRRSKIRQARRKKVLMWLRDHGIEVNPRHLRCTTNDILSYYREKYNLPEYVDN